MIARLGFANNVGDLAGYLQANFHEAPIFLLPIPWYLEHDLSCSALSDSVDVGLAVLHQSFQFASGRFWMTVH